MSPAEYRDQNFQSFIYNMNQTLLRVNQSAFTNVSIFDKEYYTALFGGRVFPDGTFMIDYLDEFMEYQKSFMRVVSKTREQQNFTFPVLSYSLLYKKKSNGGVGFVDQEFARWCSDHNCDWYDANFYNGEDVATLSNCCRLLSRVDEIDAFINSIGGTSLNIGSAVVNTTNLRRLALLADHDEDKFMQLLSDYTDLSVKVMHVTRNILKRNVEKGLLPNYKTGLVNFDNQFNTIGINGMYECIRDFGYIRTDEFDNKFYTDDGMALAEKIFVLLNRMRKQHDLGYSINVESVPGETAAVVLCKKDSMLYGNPHDDYIYANQWLALTEKCTIEEKIRLGSVLDKQCGGGSILHANLEAPFNNTDQAWDMLNHIAESGVIYFAFNVKIPICKQGHCFFGTVCPKCGGEVTDTVQRTVGYLRPTSAFTKEKQREAAEKVWFNLD